MTLLLVALVLVVGFLSSAYRARKTRLLLADFLRERGGELCPLCGSYELHEVTGFFDVSHRWLCAGCGTRFDGERVA